MSKPGFYGYSWTYLIFGWLVLLIRGEFGVAALHLLFGIFTFDLSQIILSFVYNRQYMRRHLENGWRLAGNDIENQMVATKLGVVLPPPVNLDSKSSP